MEAGNTNYYGVWFDPIGNWTQVDRFCSRRSTALFTRPLIGAWNYSYSELATISLKAVIKTWGRDLDFPKCLNFSNTTKANPNLLVTGQNIHYKQPNKLLRTKIMFAFCWWNYL